MMKLINKINTFINNQKFNKDLIIHLKEQGIYSEKINKNWQFFLPDEIYLRPIPSSDFSVFLQVFYHAQYAQVIDLIKLNHIIVNHVLDLGANVGFTSIYFDRELNNPQIYAVEPDADNFKQLKKNSQYFKNITPLNLAIWGFSTQLEPSNNTAEDWGKSFKEGGGSSDKIKALSISELTSQLNITTIDVLKIDIEGAENEIFKTDVSFLDKTKLIALEIHDDLTDRSLIYKILKDKGFLIWNYSEISIGINKKFI